MSETGRIIARRAWAAGAVALARSIFERELALSLPIVPKGQEPKEETVYDVFYLKDDKSMWQRFAFHRTLSEARNLAQAMRDVNATWIRPHAKDESQIPVEAA